MRPDRNFGLQITQLFHWEIPKKLKICKIIIFISVVLPYGPIQKSVD